jgi:hypothetical protein
MRRVPFSELPGRHERHFRRRLHPLFPRPVAADFTDDDLLEVQRLDHEELLAYLTSLRGLVQRAAELKPSEESQVVLDLKADLEKHYEEACSLADAQGNNKEAIRHLIEVIMNTIRRSAAGDPLAEQELAQEEAARRLHFQLLETPLVADLLHPETLIQPDELPAVLLTDPLEQVETALELFDETQLASLVESAEALVEKNPAAGEAERERLQWLRERLASRKDA